MALASEGRQKYIGLLHQVVEAVKHSYEQTYLLGKLLRKVLKERSVCNEELCTTCVIV
jgi:hypothetical protein